MKEFFKMAFATVVGLFIFGLCSLFILFSVAGAIASVSDTEVKVRPNSVFHLKLSGVLVERSEENSMAILMGELDDKQKTIGLDEILASIRTAKLNDNIDGIYLECDALFAAAPASLMEIRNALLEVKEEGKFVVSYADFYSQSCYLVASVSDKVLLNPYGHVIIPGMTIRTVYFKDLLDKIGVDMQVVKVGTYKSAVEPFINTSMSDANRLQLTALSNSIWTNYKSSVADSRGFTSEVINQYADKGTFLENASAAVAIHLVDSLVYRAEVKAILEDFVGKDDFKLLTLKQMTKVRSTTKYSDNKVAVLYASGAIDGNDQTDMDSEQIAKELCRLADDDDVKCVVLRVNSPGGSAYGSEQMWHATTLVKSKKPLIVSMGDYAASGGYYMSCAADTIVAQPNTITGSIGIFGLIPNIQGLTDKIGLDFDGVKTNKLSDFGDVSRPLTATEKVLLQNYINEGYELFVKRCADGRKLSVESIKAIGEGRVWSGLEAKRIGLVDEIGGLDKAIDIAVEKAGLTNYMVKEYPAKKNLFTKLMEDISSVKTDIVRETLGKDYTYFKYINQLKQMSGAQARLPFLLEIN
ncbi:MAG: signal peptide peptidase SppA [Paludibacteraceae bacterium]|jgi:protease-4|nr:signal peptide peptidase SppA [Paludibacteraceae bacterium]MDI9536589.1 signal peptide peptidase SppA [Bacteroidota bacterium]OQC34757.1 MAG: Protease 4 [Bacteroidetes bacterium ADurb.Bin057]MBP9038772.1 signal peptide peptidase SppA [Paludibacteraceae bacterium]HOA46085.1 signal peptide peptidase SppA [Paludibacteraceae bacterium]